jgi:TatD DNase family protein
MPSCDVTSPATPVAPAAMKLFDAHNHLQEYVFGGTLDTVLAEARREGVTRMVVNGSSEEDWGEVLRLTRDFPEIVPSFGYHPWYVKQRSASWQNELVRMLDTVPSGVGEIGLDRWIRDYDFEQQLEVFTWQLRLAAERNLPVSIHCLQAWGKMLQSLQNEALPSCGFVLHSYGGPAEMVGLLAELGAYFSLPGYFAHERKAKQREVFKRIPRDRLLIETDAPDQLLPPERVLYPLCNANGKPINHPGNLRAVYNFAAELLQEHVELVASQVEENFNRLFGGVFRADNSPLKR